MTANGAPKTRAFLAAIRECPSITRAAKAANIRRELHYRRLRVDEAYQAAFKEAWEQGCGALEDAAIERAQLGVREPVYYKGMVAGYVTRYPEGLTQFLLRGAMPQKYAKSTTEHTGPDGGPVQNRIEVVFVKPGDAS